MPQPIRLGMITPSSNTVLEPMTAALLAGTPHISSHSARIRVTSISMGGGSVAQFDTSPMREAAGLLADARVGSICWNGTSAGWLGPDRDRRILGDITAETGIPATSAVLDTLEALRLLDVPGFGLVTPYVADVQERVRENFEAAGFACVADRRLDITDNFAFAEVPEATIEGMIREVAQEGAPAVVVLCTNLRGARLAERLEAELGITLLDSVSVALWGAIRAAGGAPSAIRGWGRLFGLG
ncbi:Asp/Glu/hydantoin racemase [Thalassobaculum fulvum]|uniref:Asp/Glu/hydantoin racemase n=1 Tax=Thalassobaculum fulvum TaxID=1633335 RepID=A0A919CPT9_9PROT|nr:aspartate/glutamate racemase family protein [Thalassobaculum fulvum]GHD51767.1 Asp/Glu/hydantoin racemase [Thalassobaculum fulvum]